MAKVVKGARFISKIADSSGFTPTIPTNDDHTLGWLETDIYVGEWFFNTQDSKVYFRTADGIYEIITVKKKNIDNSLATGAGTTINTTYLPGNYLGAMVYQGGWDASSGQQPGYDIPNYQLKNGDYFIVTKKGNTDLDGITDWEVGDFAVFTKNGIGWQKIDNTERQEYANMVLYDNPGYPINTSPVNVQNVLDNIYQNLYLNPIYTKTVSFNKGITVTNTEDLNVIPVVITDSNTISGKEVLRLVGNETDKWLSFNGTPGVSAVLNFGTYEVANNILNIGPKTSQNISLSNTVNFRWTDGTSSPTYHNRWTIYSSSDDSYIGGFNDNNTRRLVNLTTKPNQNNYLNNNLIVGIDSTYTSFLSNSIATLQVNSSSSTTKLALTRSNSSVGINTELNSISFYQSVNTTTYNEYAKISVRTSDDSNRGTIGFNVKSNVGNVLTEGLTLKGTSDGVYLGINLTNPIVGPTVPLDVNGNTNISGKLVVNNVSEQHEFTGNVLFNNNILTNGLLNMTKSSSDNLFILNNNELSFYWTNAIKLLEVKGTANNTHISYDTITGNITFNGGDITLDYGDLNLYNGGGLYMNGGMIHNASFSTFQVSNIVSYSTSFGMVDFVSDNNIVNKKYVDEYVANHSVGLWAVGYIGGSLDTHAVVKYDVGNTYYVGINKNDPTYNLDVLGNTRISSHLYLGENIYVSGKLLVGNVVSTPADVIAEYSKSGGSTIRLTNSNTVTAVDEKIGSIEFYSKDSDGPKISSYIKSVARETSGRKGALTFGVSITNNTDAVEVMKLNENGDLVLGLTSSATSSKFYINNNTSYHSLFIEDTSDLNFNKFVVDTTGNVGLNTTNTTYLLNVNGKTRLFSSTGIGTTPDLTGSYILKVTGNSNYQGDSEFIGDVSIGTTITSGSTYNLYVNGTSYFNNNVGINGYNSNAKLFVNGNTYVGKLGIGSTTFTHELDIIGNGYISSSLGIGGFDATYKLSANGNIKAVGYYDYTNSAYYLKPANTTTSLRVAGGILAKGDLRIEKTSAKIDIYGATHDVTKINFFDDGSIISYIESDSSNNLFTIHSSNYIYIDNNIGIGTIPDSNKMKVNGKSYLMDNVGIGAIPTTTEKLTVNGTSSFSSNVGIGTIPTTTEKLTVNGTSSFSSNVGIGTTPSTVDKLTVNGSTYTKVLNKNKSITRLVQGGGVNCIDIEDTNEYDDYVYNIQNLNNDIVIRFMYYDINMLKNRKIHFDFISNQNPSNDIQFTFYCTKLEKNGVNEEILLIDKQILGGMTNELTKYIKFDLSLYELFYYFKGDVYEQHIIWNYSQYGELYTSYTVYSQSTTVYSQSTTVSGHRHRSVVNDSGDSDIDVLLYQYAGNKNILGEYLYDWTRSGTVVTITQIGHGLNTNDKIHITYSSDYSVTPYLNNNYTITKVSDDVFRINGVNTGDTTGKISCYYTTS